MKFLVSFVVLAFASATLAHHTLTAEQKAKWTELKTACIADSGATEEMIKKAKHDGVFEDEAKLGKFFLCLGKKTGFQNEAGELQAEVIKTKIAELYDTEVAEKVVKECVHEKKATPEETAIAFAKCKHAHVPKHQH